ncbi:MAG: hypothetical protein JWM86_2700 [Thermoleophilia bacterium]|nr:hypothetical protein [Thermoleophilia bacterium]
MIRPRKHLRTIAVLGSVVLVGAGCGGGEAPADPAAGGAATPGATTPGAVAGDTGAIPAATDPATGQPVDPAAATTGGTTATIPDLIGGDVGGSFGAIGSAPVFTAKAAEGDSLKDSETSEDSTSSSGSVTGTTSEAPTTSTKAAPTFSGAKIYVDGIVHDVTRGGTFPKGNPVFKLVSVTGTEIEVELIAGEFTTGGGTGTVLDKGDLVSLVNASEQLTYRIKYLRGITSTSAVTF